MILSKRGLPRVLLADDHPALRTGIRARLEIDAVAVVVAEAGDGVHALELVQEHQPDLALLDLRMPGLDGVEVAEQILRRRLPTRVVLLTALTDVELIQHALEVGVRGYVDKGSHLDVMVAAVQAVAAGQRFVDPSLLASFVAGAARESLSQRELQVLQLTANGMQNKTIALELDLSEETVKSHLRNVMRKLDVQSRTGAVTAAFRRSLIS